MSMYDRTHSPTLPPTQPTQTHLVFAEQGEVEEDLQRLRVRRHHDQLRNAAVQRLRRCGC
jgi:hypothetical protein